MESLWIHDAVTVLSYEITERTHSLLYDKRVFSIFDWYRVRSQSVGKVISMKYIVKPTLRISQILQSNSTL